jgi:hypothetical protein
MGTNLYPPDQAKKRFCHRGWLILLLALLLSFGCVFCSSGAALNFWPDRLAPASLLASSQADYGRGPVDELQFRVLDPEVVAQAAADIAFLQITPTNIWGDALVRVAMLPATPTPTTGAGPNPLLPSGSPAVPTLPPTSAVTVAGTATPVINPTATIAPPTTTLMDIFTPTPPATPTPVPPIATPTFAPPSVTPTSLPPTATPLPPPPSPIPAPPDDDDDDDDQPASPTATPLPTPIPPTLAFNPVAFNVGEGDGLAVITVNLSAASSQMVSVDYATSDLDAVAGVDYIATSGTLIFPPGVTSAAFTITITADLTMESNESLFLTLSNPANAVIDSNNPTTLTIMDDDIPLPSVEFMLLALSVYEGDSASLNLIVILDSPAAFTVMVDYQTEDDSASAGADYTASSGTLTFAPGQTSQMFTVPIINDSADESNEQLTLRLDNPVNATLGAQATAVLLIIDDDPAVGCWQNIPPGEPNIGAPNGIIAEIGCGQARIIDLGASPITTHPDYDFVYYEFENPPGFVTMDWVIVQVGADSSGPWHTVFYWGDGLPDTNTNLAGLSLPENDNRPIPTTELYGSAPYISGITIDVDQRAPAGVYQYLRLLSPFGGDNDGAQVDAIQFLP